MNDAAYRIRVATIQDSRAIGSVQLESWHTMFPDAGVNAVEYLTRFSIDEREESWRELLTALAPDQSIFVAENEDGQVVGFGTGNPENNPDVPYKSELAVVHVLPVYRNQGVGHQLMYAVAAQLFQAGYSSLWLWTLMGNARARSLYERLGGVPAGEQTKMIGKDEIGVAITEVAYGWLDISTLLRVL